VQFVFAKSIIVEELRKAVLNFEILKMQKDLPIHYDKEPIKVYGMITKLDIEESFKKLIPFLGILNDLFAFTHQLAFGFQKKTEQPNLELNRRTDSIADLIDKHKPADNEKIITELKESILSLNKLFR